MSLLLRFQEALETFRQANYNFSAARSEPGVSRREMAAAGEAREAARTALDEAIGLIKAEQVLTIGLVEEVKFFSRSLPMFYERGALRRVVIRGSNNTRLSEETSKKIRRALLAYGFKACEQMFDLPPVA